MGLFSWWKRPSGGSPKPPSQQPSKGAGDAVTQVEAAGIRGAVEVRRQRQAHATVFEFRSAAESGAAVTLAGCCLVSDELESCRWELVPASGEGTPQFRIVF